MLWLIMCGAELATYATRASFIVLARKLVIPARLQHAFRFLPVAILSALVFSQVFPGFHATLHR
jgi:branched-subunit amino acid transport protein